MRFIDLARDGGCSKKAPALQLRRLLNAVAIQHGGRGMETLSSELPDSGLYNLGSELILSTVDIVLPMTVNPFEFGRVTVLHVLSDLYASGGLPRFALCFLGLPAHMAADSKEAVETLSGAVGELAKEGATLLGGHTIISQADFFLGFAAFGVALPGSSPGKRQAQEGDQLIITKPLGTGMAVSRWKLEPQADQDHADVLAGMLLSNRSAAEILNRYPISSCTDVTGYGMLGHLYNLMSSSQASCRLSLAALPVYKSIIGCDLGMSGQGAFNIEYVLPYIKITATMNSFRESIVFDSEVSGGLLFSVAREYVVEICQALSTAGYSPSVIGEVISGPAGAIELTE